MISDEERESNEFTQTYTIGEIFDSDCMNDDIHVIGLVVTRTTARFGLEASLDRDFIADS